MESDGEFFHGFVLNSDSGDPAWFTAAKPRDSRSRPPVKPRRPSCGWRRRLRRRRRAKAAALGGVRVARVTLATAASRNASPRSRPPTPRRAFRSGETGLVTRGAAAATALVALAGAAARGGCGGGDARRGRLAALLKRRAGALAVAAAESRERNARRRARARARARAHARGSDTETAREERAAPKTSRPRRFAIVGRARATRAGSAQGGGERRASPTGGAFAVAAAARRRSVAAEPGGPRRASGGDGAARGWFAPRGARLGARAPLARRGPRRARASPRRARRGRRTSIVRLGHPRLLHARPRAAERSMGRASPRTSRHARAPAGRHRRGDGARRRPPKWAGDLHSHAADPALVHSLVDVNHGLCDVVERIEGTSLLDWSLAESRGLPLNFARSGALGLKDAKETSARR